MRGILLHKVVALSTTHAVTAPSFRPSPFACKPFSGALDLTSKMAYLGMTPLGALSIDQTVAPPPHTPFHAPIRCPGPHQQGCISGHDPPE